jgi:hypothetical protein
MVTIEEFRTSQPAGDYIRLKKIDEFDKYIASATKHDLFNLADSGFYQQLDELRRLRNRIHIQNTRNDFERNEYDAFNDDRKALAEKALLKKQCERWLRSSPANMTT